MDDSRYDPFSREVLTRREQRKVDKRFAPPPENMARSQEYRAKNPQPSYSKFKEPDFIDQYGREYAVAKGDFVEQQRERGVDITDGFAAPSTTSDQAWGGQLLWFRMPIALRHTVGLPDAHEGAVKLFNVRNQVVATGVIDEAFVYPRRRTGYVVLRNVSSSGQAADPSLWTPLLRENLKKSVVVRGF